MQGTPVLAQSFMNAKKAIVIFCMKVWFVVYIVFHLNTIDQNFTHIYLEEFNCLVSDVIAYRKFFNGCAFISFAMFIYLLRHLFLWGEYYSYYKRLRVKKRIP